MIKKEIILNILGERFKPNTNLDYYLLDFRGNNINLKTETNKTILFSNDSFNLYVVEGVIYLETSSSNQLIDDEWIQTLQDLKRIQLIIQTLIRFTD